MFEDDYVRLTAHTSVTDHHGGRHVYSFSHVYPRDMSDSMLAEHVFRLCVEMTTRMVKRNHLFGCTIGPLRVVMTDADGWPQDQPMTPISSSSSSEPRAHRAPGLRLLE